MSNEREKDKRRIDKLLDAWEREIDGDPSLETLVLASRSLPALLERRSKLLGLDATPDDKDRSSAAESPVKRIMAVVPRATGTEAAHGSGASVEQQSEKTFGVAFPKGGGA